MKPGRVWWWSGIAALAIVSVVGSALFWPRVRKVEPPRPKLGRGVKAVAGARMFSAEYVEAVSDILELEESDAAKLRERVRKNPEDLIARLRLLAYYKRADQVGRAENVGRRWEQVAWLTQHRPESEILRSPQAQFAGGS